ncbi:dienelactone hydrolase family protein [Curtobacterium citreum]|uniref:Dienelactone hydrolase family protein n=1 Tax=Curtobacterium citreum TaxID=2036 RepID=A0A850DTT6_9MICO|nr:dienelactone hydrolase family protein [Curtobacterium citreum]KTR08701.1 dienelactone hydrolase [Curtobacterium citreum]MDK8171774.1 dienelactone hydrolase family protein [Curtobacterium citreum]NUU27885.1 dienelactone hydrolase family protein [Curtobacterium albidum]
MKTTDDVLSTVPAPAGSDVRVEPVRYDHEGTALLGVLAKDHAESGPRPAVLVVHDWHGVNEHVEARVAMLARLGYVAFGADVYGEGVRPGDDTASEVAGSFYQDLPLFRARLTAGLDRLREDPDVDHSRIVVMGYCFGGSGALELARTGADLVGAVSFHGGLIAHDPSDAAAIRAKLLVLTGGSDPVVPDSAVTAWQDEMRSAPEVDWQVVTYAGAMHAFAVPGTDAPDHGAQYQERADRRSWQALQVFLAEVFDEEPTIV